MTRATKRTLYRRADSSCVHSKPVNERCSLTLKVSSLQLLETGQPLLENGNLDVDHDEVKFRTCDGGHFRSAESMEDGNEERNRCVSDRDSSQQTIRRWLCHFQDNEG